MLSLFASSSGDAEGEVPVGRGIWQLLTCSKKKKNDTVPNLFKETTGNLKVTSQPNGKRHSFTHHYDCLFELQGKSCFIGGNATSFCAKIKAMGIDCNATNVHGESMLHLAVLSGNEDIVKFLLSVKNARTNQKDLSNQSPLHWICRVQVPNREILLLLLKHGADVHQKDDVGNTPLHYACMNSSLSLVQALVDHGATNTALNKSGLSPSAVTAASNKEEILSIFGQSDPESYKNQVHHTSPGRFGDNFSVRSDAKDCRTSAGKVQHESVMSIFAQILGPFTPEKPVDTNRTSEQIPKGSVPVSQMLERPQPRDSYQPHMKNFHGKQTEEKVTERDLDEDAQLQRFVAPLFDEADEATRRLKQTEGKRFSVFNERNMQNSTPGSRSILKASMASPRRLFSAASEADTAHSTQNNEVDSQPVPQTSHSRSMSGENENGRVEYNEWEQRMNLWLSSCAPDAKPIWDTYAKPPPVPSERSNCHRPQMKANWPGGINHQSPIRSTPEKLRVGAPALKGHESPNFIETRSSATPYMKKEESPEFERMRSQYQPPMKGNRPCISLREIQQAGNTEQEESTPSMKESANYRPQYQPPMKGNRPCISLREIQQGGSTEKEESTPYMQESTNYRPQYQSPMMQNRPCISLQDILAQGNSPSMNSNLDEECTPAENEDNTPKFERFRPQHRPTMKRNQTPQSKNQDCSRPVLDLSDIEKSNAEFFVMQAVEEEASLDFTNDSPVSYMQRKDLRPSLHAPPKPPLNAPPKSKILSPPKPVGPPPQLKPSAEAPPRLHINTNFENSEEEYERERIPTKMGALPMSPPMKSMKERANSLHPTTLEPILSPSKKGPEGLTRMSMHSPMKKGPECAALELPYYLPTPYPTSTCSNDGVKHTPFLFIPGQENNSEDFNDWKCSLKEKIAAERDRIAKETEDAMTPFHCFNYVMTPKSKGAEPTCKRDATQCTCKNHPKRENINTPPKTVEMRIKSEEERLTTLRAEMAKRLTTSRRDRESDGTESISSLGSYAHHEQLPIYFDATLEKKIKDIAKGLPCVLEDAQENSELVQA